MDGSSHVREKNRQETPTIEQLQELDCLKDLDLFETTCKILNIPTEVKKIWASRRLKTWFRAKMTAWLYEYAKKHMSKHSRVNSAYQLDIGVGAFNSFCNSSECSSHAVKRTSRTGECSVRIATDVLQDTETESAESMSQEQEMEH